MSGKTGSYIIGGLQIIAGIVLTVFSSGTLATIGGSLIVSGAATIAGTALSATPPRPKDSLRDSAHYGIDVFDNPRGSESNIAVLYGEHRVKPSVIAESVSSIAENNAPGVDAQKKQGVKWLSVICEGVIDKVADVEIQDRPALSDLLELRDLGKGNGTKREFTFPHNWIYMGGDETPEVEVFVDGVKKSYAVRSTAAEFLVPVGTSRNFDVVRDLKTERILEATARVFIRGPGYPQFEQLRHVGVFRWSSQKLSPYKLRVRFRTRPTAGLTLRIEYDYLATDGLAIVQDSKGVTKAIFSTAVANNKKVTATYKTSPFHGLKIRWTPGTLDQKPIEGFTNIEQSRNPREQLLTKNAPITYTTEGREVHNLRFGITAPQGFIRYTADGGTAAVTATLRLEYRRPGGAWTTLRSGSGETFGLVAEKPSTVRWEVDIRVEWERRFLGGDNDAGEKLAALDFGALEGRVTRLTGIQGDNNPLIRDELIFAYVTEITNEAFSYPGTAMLALSAMPSAFLTGSALRVSALVRRAKLYDPRTAGGSRDLGRSSNAALAIRDLVTSSEGAASERFGGGNFFTGLDLILGAAGEKNGFTAFADFCDAWVHRPGDDATVPASETNGERRCRLDIMLDTPQSLMETVGDMAFLGYCFATLQGALWRFPLDQDGESEFTFVDDVDPPNQNMTNFVLKLDEWGKTPTGMQGSFWNEALNFERDELFYPVDVPTGTPHNVRDVDLRGCTRETEGSRMLRHLAEQAREMPFPCSWQATPGSQHVEAGDIVTVKTRVPYSTGANVTELKVRVLAGAVTRGEDGKVALRYAGRVMASAAYQLQASTVPVSRPPNARSAAAIARITLFRARVA